MTSNNMRDIDAVRTVFLSAPPMVRSTLLGDPDISKATEKCVGIDAIVSINEIGAHFYRRELFDSVIDIVNTNSYTNINDLDNRNWKIEFCLNKYNKPDIIFSFNSDCFSVSYLLVLSDKKEFRLGQLDKIKNDKFISIELYKKWYDKLSNYPLRGYEVTEFVNELFSTTDFLEENITNVISSNNFDILQLIPYSHVYYENLVGKYRGERNFSDYAEFSCKNHLDSLYKWDTIKGVQYGLFLSSHSLLTSKMDISQIDDFDLVKLITDIQKYGDKISQLGAIDILFSEFKNEYESLIFDLITQIIDDNVDSKESGFRLLSALFTFVYGEMSRVHLFSDTPPFYRKLASLAHASLIQRQINKTNINLEDFSKILLDYGHQFFYTQILCDVRHDPRFTPYYATSFMLKRYFLNRIIKASHMIDKKNVMPKLQNLIFNNKQKSVSSQLGDPNFFVPGLIDGKEFYTESNDNCVINEKISEFENSNLSSDLLYEFIIFASKNDFDCSNLNCEKVKIDKFILMDGRTTDEILTDLNAFSIISVLIRSPEISEKIKIICRILRTNKKLRLSAIQEFKLCLLSSASNSNFNDWIEFIGAWMTELAFENLEPVEINQLLLAIRTVCDLVPELWLTCGKAEAALKSLKY